VKAIEYTPAGYWERRYRDGRTSGAGSEGDEGAYKAKYLTDFTHKHGITSVIDWGCGDGQVLELVRFPEGIHYVGVDVSPIVVNRLREKFVSPYSFATVDEHMTRVENLRLRLQANTPHEITGHALVYQLAVSMDVLFHFPDDTDYFSYLLKLFGSADKYVMIYSTNYAGGRTARHVFRREFTPDIAERFPNWELRTVETPLREGLASFFVYEKVSLCDSP
jgi:SAM-dependent methyltransferase